MKVYHGSWMEIAEPDLKHSRTDVDFGKGFYTTPLREQAVKWCGKFKRRGKQGIVTTYEFDESTSSSLKILSFDSYSEEWLDFILKCRRKQDSSDYDIVMGGVANDKQEAIKRLRYEKPNMQICFRSERALKQLHFEGSFEV